MVLRTNSLFKEKNSYKLIDGKYTINEPYGYCCCNYHRGYLSKKILENKKCTSKSCYHFKKNEYHPHWIRKEQLKALKQAKKEGKDFYIFNGINHSVKENV